MLFCFSLHMFFFWHHEGGSTSKPPEIISVKRDSRFRIMLVVRTSAWQWLEPGFRQRWWISRRSAGGSTAPAWPCSPEVAVPNLPSLSSACCTHRIMVRGGSINTASHSISTAHEDFAAFTCPLMHSFLKPECKALRFFWGGGVLKRRCVLKDQFFWFYRKKKFSLIAKLSLFSGIRIK